VKIFFNGSSFAFGSYPDHLAKLLNTEDYTNISRPGYSNRSILRTTLEENLKNYDLAVIQLTSPSRTEFYRENKWIEISAQLSHARLTENDKEFWKCYYENIYQDKMGDVDEDIIITGIRDHFIVANIPCVVVTSEKYTRSKKFDINLWDINFPLDKTRHPTNIGHRMIAKNILKIIETKYPNLKLKQ
tara:strand:- start:143 stop:706 length:564 start_codon:yes stop_codon:yes gene_type:complete